MQFIKKQNQEFMAVLVLRVGVEFSNQLSEQLFCANCFHRVARLWVHVVFGVEIFSKLHKLSKQSFISTILVKLPHNTLVFTDCNKHVKEGRA